MTPARFTNNSNDSALHHDVNDDLIGRDVTTTVDGKVLPGIATSRHNGEGYICDFGQHGRITLTRAEVLGDRDFIATILKHRNVGVRAEVLIQWELASAKKWVPVQQFRNDEYNAEVIAEYALLHGLLDTRGWAWTRSLIRDSQLTAIQKHRVRGGSLQVLVKWDHGEETWESVSELSQNADEEEREKLARYAQENDLLDCKGLTWAEKHLKERSRKWLDPVQRYLIDPDRLVESSRLTEALHHAYVKSMKSGAPEQDIKALGRAFKQSIDISKHGGIVDLPFHLRKQVNEKKLKKYLRWV